MQAAARISTDHLQQAMQLQVGGKLAEAAEIYRSMLSSAPHHPELNYLMSVVMMQQRDVSAALDYLRKSCRAEPANPRYVSVLVKHLVSLNMVDEALDVLGRAFKEDTNRSEWLKQLVELARENQKFDYLATYLRQFAKKLGHVPDFLWLNGQLLLKLDRDLDAVPYLKRLFELNSPKTEEMVLAYARALNVTNEPSDARLILKALHEAIALDPNNYRLYQACEYVHQRLGEFDQAGEMLRKAVMLGGNLPKLQFDLCVFDMKVSNMQHGLEAYTARHQVPEHGEQSGAMEIPLPTWQGEPVAGKKILVWAEQGVGEVMMWAGLLPWLVAQGATVHLAIYPKMQALMERSFPDIRILLRRTDFDVTMLEEGYDYQLPMGDLMLRGLPHYTPSAHDPVLKADAARAQALRQKYLAQAGLDETGRLIGISWGTMQKSAVVRNVPLDLWAPLFKEKNTAFVSLQYDRRFEDVQKINKRFPNKLLFDESIQAVRDMDAWAAQCAAMDEIISIQNSAAHMGGALGIPTTLLLSTYGCWRWGQQDHNLWYRSVTIVRQQPEQSWKDVVKNLAKNRQYLA